uniref:Uncharacterized protein n=1 Tax=Emiliania huxleyi TaxID=2903 RepID=A0A7S3TRP4_EMIHU
MCPPIVRGTSLAICSKQRPPSSARLAHSVAYSPSTRKPGGARAAAIAIQTRPRTAAGTPRRTFSLYCSGLDCENARHALAEPTRFCHFRTSADSRSASERLGVRVASCSGVTMKPGSDQ